MWNKCWLVVWPYTLIILSPMEKPLSSTPKMTSPNTMSSSKLETPSLKVFSLLIIMLITLQDTINFKKHTTVKSTLVQKLAQKKESPFSMITKKSNLVTLNLNVSTHLDTLSKAVASWFITNLENKTLSLQEILSF